MIDSLVVYAAQASPFELVKVVVTDTYHSLSDVPAPPALIREVSDAGIFPFSNRVPAC